jgi:hypothetical protein
MQDTPLPLAHCDGRVKAIQGVRNNIICVFASDPLVLCAALYVRASFIAYYLLTLFTSILTIMLYTLVLTIM